ncbi:serum paraoxonase/arylesterase family protein [Ilyonectria robusta]
MALTKPILYKFWTILVPIFVAYVYGPLVYRHLTVFGILRRTHPTLTNPEDIITIQDTTHCEDLHYYSPRQILFTACEDTFLTRFSWFPPLEVFDNPAVTHEARGSIHVIDLEASRTPPTGDQHWTMKSRRLRFTNFDGPFVTHGIDVLPDPESANGDAVYIFAVNHVPNMERVDVNTDSTDRLGSKPPHRKSHSRIEVFHHTLGSDSVHHIRSVRHPLIATPNDIFAIGKASFYITNDHYYPEGPLRAVEIMYFGAKWSNIVQVQFSVNTGAQAGLETGVNASVVLSELHNNNGLGHGRSPSELLIGSAASGTLHFARLPGDADTAIEVVDSIPFDSTIDNPTYFSDPFANSTYDASGYVIAGLPRAIDLTATARDPGGKDGAMVWYVKQKIPDSSIVNESRTGSWEKRLLFQDDGERIRSASTALLVAIDPRIEGPQRKAWLFITGPWSENMIAVKIDI